LDVPLSSGPLYAGYIDQPEPVTAKIAIAIKQRYQVCLTAFDRDGFTPSNGKY
jgi:hypothetical protein